MKTLNNQHLLPDDDPQLSEVVGALKQAYVGTAPTTLRTQLLQTLQQQPVATTVTTESRAPKQSDKPIQWPAQARTPQPKSYRFTARIASLVLCLITFGFGSLAYLLQHTTNEHTPIRAGSPTRQVPGSLLGAPATNGTGARQGTPTPLPQNSTVAAVKSVPITITELRLINSTTILFRIRSAPKMQIRIKVVATQTTDNSISHTVVNTEELTTDNQGNTKPSLMPVGIGIVTIPPSGIRITLTVQIITPGKEGTATAQIVIPGREQSLKFSSNLREQPNNHARIITVLTKGTHVSVIEQQGAWDKVQITKSKLQGWIEAKDLALNIPAYAIESLPTTNTSIATATTIPLLPPAPTATWIPLATSTPIQSRSTHTQVKISPLHISLTKDTVQNGGDIFAYITGSQPHKPVQLSVHVVTPHKDIMVTQCTLAADSRGNILFSLPITADPKLLGSSVRAKLSAQTLPPITGGEAYASFTLSPAPGKQHSAKQIPLQIVPAASHIRQGERMILHIRSAPHTRIQLIGIENRAVAFTSSYMPPSVKTTVVTNSKGEAEYSLSIPRDPSPFITNYVSSAPFQMTVLAQSEDQALSGQTIAQFTVDSAA